MESEEHPADVFFRFVDTFTKEDHPAVLAMSGGEALLRPALVRQLADRAREAGTRSTVLSGMYFASSGRIPGLIGEAIRAVDHFSASLDAFHEREVPREGVYRVLDILVGEGRDVSIHLVGEASEDPYLERTCEEIERRFASRVPVLVNTVRHFGRARDWLRAAPEEPGAEPNPCEMAAWPLVGFDGTIVACGNDDALDSRPPHLVLGDARVDAWSTIRQRTLQSSLLRAIRLYGPEYVAARFGASAGGCAGYCATCMHALGEAALARRVDQAMARPSTAWMERLVERAHRQAGAVMFARRHGLPRHAALVTLGAPPAP